MGGRKVYLVYGFSAVAGDEILKAVYGSKKKAIEAADSDDGRVEVAVVDDGSRPVKLED